MPIAELIDQYGYWAVFAGSLLEGETILLLAGIAANQGALSFAPVVALAFIGGMMGDQLLFQLGRRYGPQIMARFPALEQRARPVHRLIERHQRKLIVGVRFMYGLRLVGPFVIGMSEVTLARFALLNLLGAALWAPLIVGAGYLFGEALRWLIGDLGRYEAIALCAAMVIAASVYLLHRKRSSAKAP